MTTTTRPHINRDSAIFAGPAPREADPARNVPREPRSEELIRRFAVGVFGDDKCFTIVELAPTYCYPINWIDGAMTREAAWQAACAQDRPVCLLWDLGNGPGVCQPLGIVQTPEAFERAVYRGYVSYGHSMSDGYYRPVDFEAWQAGFRRSVMAAGDGAKLRHVEAYVDVTEGVRESFGSYRELLGAVVAGPWA